MRRRGTGESATNRSPAARRQSRQKTGQPVGADARRLSDFAAHASDWFWETDPELTITFVTQRAGSPAAPAGLLGANLRSLPLDPGQPGRQTALLAALAELQAFGDVDLVAGNDGAILRLSGGPILDGERRLRGYRGVATDIAALARLEATLQHVQRQSAALFDASPNALAVVARDGLVVELNAACAGLFCSGDGASAIGRPFRDWVAPEHRMAVESALAQAFAGRPADAECQAVDAAGRIFWIGLSVAPVAPAGMNIETVIAVARDISHYRLADDRLREAEKLEAVGRLTGGVAHDFNNILTVIIGNSELLAERLEGDEEARQLAEISLSAARAGADLTRMLLAYSRRQSLQPTEFCAADMLREVRSLLERSIGDNVEIEILADDDPWGIVADRAQLASVLLNLSLNARDAMPRGGQIVIEARNALLDSDYARTNPEVAPGEYVLISVSDSGLGMPAHVLDRVFEPFFTTKEVGKGSGLGLSMVYGFAKQSGGHVKIYSEAGIGTVVRLYLPRAQVQLSLPNIEPEAGSQSARPGETVMVVEDNRQVRAFIVGELERLGYGVVAVTDGKAALARLRDMKRLDLLLSDVVMPGIDGVRLVERARRLRPNLKILLMSGYTERGLGQGDRFALKGPLLTKPFTRLDLARKVRAAIEGRL